jgi:ADP-heptose:LPS heptosyltransferase
VKQAPSNSAGGRFPASIFGPYRRQPPAEPPSGSDPALPVPPVPAPPPRWVAAPGAERPPVPRSVLIHQARFRVGDTLWLTPLLRAVRRAFPAAAVTVVAGPLARQVLERSPHLSALVIWDPAGGEAARRRLLDRLAGMDFDTALFALARRDKSRWLAAAMVERGVPCRVNLEYDLGEAPAPADLFTHEGWFVWGTMASPCLLLHALHPWLGEGDWTADRRVEMPVSAAERAAAGRALAAAGIGDGPFVILAPAGHSSDRWPAERFGELAARLAAELGVGVLVEGAPADEPLLRAVAERAASLGAPRVRTATDPLGVLAALLERARLLAGNDSAPIHVAEAAGTPTLYFAHREKLVHSHPAGAAWALYDEERNRLADISVEQVLGAVREMSRRGIAPFQ